MEGLKVRGQGSGWNGGTGGAGDVNQCQIHSSFMLKGAFWILRKVPSERFVSLKRGNVDGPPMITRPRGRLRPPPIPLLSLQSDTVTAKVL